MKIFISYAKNDAESAKRLYDNLSREGFQPCDEDDILPGQDQKVMVNKMIKESSYFLLLLSSASLSEKGFIHKEQKIALDIADELPESDIFIIPVRLDECKLPLKIQNFKSVDLFPSYEKGFEKILESLYPKKTDKAETSKQKSVDKHEEQLTPPKAKIRLWKNRYFQIIICILIVIVSAVFIIQSEDEFGKEQFIRIPGEEYMMGCINGDSECEDNEKPPHKVLVNSFLVGKYEVTQKQWQKIMGRNSAFSCKNCPVNASWNDVQKFIHELNKKTGKKYRLPTEAEWEFACRSTGKEDKYSGGNDLNTLGWYDQNSKDTAHPVGTKQPNALGIYDMSGNVWEWCEDVYCPDAYENISCQQSAGNDKNAEHVIRGGSWKYSAANSRCTSRRGLSPVQTADDIGFRLVSEDFSDAK